MTKDLGANLKSFFSQRFYNITVYNGVYGMHQLIMAVALHEECVD